MQATNVKASGGFVTWSLATWSWQEKLQESLTAIGMGNHAPAPMTAGQALREAMEKVCGRRTENAWQAKRTLVRPLADPNSFCVVEEERGKTANRYPQMLYASVDPDTLAISFDPYDDSAQEIVKEFHEHRKYVSGTAVGGALVSMVKSLNGTAIRKTGGFYAITSPRFEAWQKIADAVEPCHAYGTTSVYLVRLEVDAGSIRVVRDAIREEILEESKKLLEEIGSGTLGEKALENRVKYIDTLEDKVKEYESIVGDSLNDLKDALSSCVTAIGLASFNTISGRVSA